MKLEDLAECDAEVIQPIKYEYKAKEGQDGVSLWEVRKFHRQCSWNRAELLEVSS